MRYINLIIGILSLVLTFGCSSSLPETAIGQLRIDNTPKSGACRLTVLGATQRPYYDVKVMSKAGSVLLDARVPNVNSKPGVWKHFQTDLAGQTISIKINDGVFSLDVLKDTKEIVIAEREITQYPKPVGWL